MRTFAILLSALPLISAANAQLNPSDVTFASIESQVESDVTAAVSALNSDDFDRAAQLLRAASANADRLLLQNLTQKIANATPSFSPEDANFVLATSSTVGVEGLFARRETVEREFRDEDGRLVTVRVFDENRDLADFDFIKEDTAMLAKDGLEVVSMRGEPAIKRRGDDGALSVLMMSSDDHALIEVEGGDEGSVMAFIEELEESAKN